jgi:hypothetical protein
MTESEWQSCRETEAMLDFVLSSSPPRGWERKVRLFSCACVRRVWHLLVDERTRKAIEALERYVDGGATEQERRSALGDTREVWRLREANAQQASRSGTEPIAQAHLLRDLFGPLPFRPVALDPAWLTWGNGTVGRLARAAYDGRQMPAGTLELERLGVLADALEAGYGDQEVLEHPREQGGVHVRGCWLIDLLLGKS